MSRYCVINLTNNINIVLDLSGYWKYRWCFVCICFSKASRAEGGIFGCTNVCLIHFVIVYLLIYVRMCSLFVGIAWTPRINISGNRKYRFRSRKGSMRDSVNKKKDSAGKNQFQLGKKTSIGKRIQSGEKFL